MYPVYFNLVYHLDTFKQRWYKLRFQMLQLMSQGRAGGGGGGTLDFK